VTGRLRRHAGQAVGAGRAVSAVSADLPISWPTAHAAFAARADAELGEPGPPRVLASTRRAAAGRCGAAERERAVGAADRFETNFVDLTGRGGLLGQTGGRTKDTVTQ
jgi:hypothetical protein